MIAVHVLFVESSRIIYDSHYFKYTVSGKANDEIERKTWQVCQRETSRILWCSWYTDFQG